MPAISHTRKRPVHPADRTAQERADDEVLRLRERHRAAVRAHDVDRRPDAAACELGGQGVEIGAHGGRQVGVEDRGRESARTLRARERRRRRRETGTPGRSSRSRSGRVPLGGIVDVGVHEAHRHRIDALAPEHGHDLREVVAVEARLDAAVGEGPLRHLQAHFARGERRRPDELDVEEPAHEPACPADLDRVPKSLRRHHAGPGRPCVRGGHSWRSSCRARTPRCPRSRCRGP